MSHQLLGRPSVRVQNLRPACFDILSPDQSMHGRASPMHGVKNHKVAGAIIVALEANDCSGVAWLLKIDGRQECLVDIRAILHGTSCEVTLNAEKKLFVSFESAIRGITEHANLTVDL
jgi:hypothetical protein